MNWLLMQLNLQYFAEADTGGGEGEQQTEQQDTQQEQKETKTFTQEDVNNLIAKETKAAQEKLLKQAGVTDFANLKEGMAKFKEWQESQKTEAQKQAEALEQYQKDLEATKAEKELTELKLEAFVAGAKAESIDDVLLLAKARMSDEVSKQDAIKQVLEAYPQFKQGQAEQKEEKPSVPTFSTGSTIPGNSTNDPFASKLAKYL